MNEPVLEIRSAVTDDDYETVSELVAEYLRSLDFTVDFQEVDREVQGPRTVYGAPDGRALLAFVDATAAGVVGVTRFDPASCELKRMYVRPAYRKLGLGRLLAEAAIGAAREVGYREMLLDTVESLHAANALYESLGFRDIPAYRHNPRPDARYLALAL